MLILKILYKKIIRILAEFVFILNFKRNNKIYI